MRRRCLVTQAWPSASRLWHGLLSITRKTFRRTRRTSSLRRSRKVWALNNGGELVAESRPLLQRQRAEHMGRVSHAERVDAGMDADACPGLVQRAVEPEAGLVLEHGYATARGDALSRCGRNPPGAAGPARGRVPAMALAILFGLSEVAVQREASVQPDPQPAT